uniref:Putative secreted protein n=1 Tax=Amblyomma triste TaxID=251400 RepID=A0A023G4C7_AMBTT
MSRYVLVLACVALIAALTSAAPAKNDKEEPVDPSSGPTGGLLDAFKAAGGQLQRVADGFPLSFNNAASRFQTWVEGAGSTVGKSATDTFGFTRQLFKPLRTEDVQPPSSSGSSSPSS